MFICLLPIGEGGYEGLYFDLKLGRPYVKTPEGQVIEVSNKHRYAKIWISALKCKNWLRMKVTEKEIEIVRMAVKLFGGDEENFLFI